MKKRLSSFFTLLTLTHLSWVSSIEPVNSQASCQATVDSILRQISRKGTSVDFYVYQNFPYTDTYLGNTDRLDSVSFVMAGVNQTNRQNSVAENILVSSVLMKSYANRIFANCGGTGSVSFGLNNTDWGERFFMTDTGNLLYELCVYFPEDLVNNILFSPIYHSLGNYCAIVTPDF
jgi:hypothetical protein